MTDPFDVFGGADEAVVPRPAFAEDLRRRLGTLLGPPVMPPPFRRSPMAAHMTPYLAVADGAAALAFYREAFGAEEVMRVAEPSGRIGHAELRFGGARLYLSDEYPEIGVVSPRSLGGTSVTIHLEVDDVDDAYERAVAQGATAVAEPANQPHGARHGTLVDPFGHRWMLSQQIEQLSTEALADRMAPEGWDVSAPSENRPEIARAGVGGIWAALNYADARAGIAFVVDVLGFVADLVVPGDGPGVVEHSQLRWPEGGVVQASSAGRPGNVFSNRPTGAENLYVITADPAAVYDRCVAAGVEIVLEPSSPDYDPHGMVFSLRDPEGNLWSFGTYAGEG